MDKFTFGNSSAAIKLAELLSNQKDEKVCRKVTRLVCRMCQTRDNLREIPDPRFKKMCVEMWHKHLKNQIKDYKFEYQYETNLLNLLNIQMKTV
jgi:hypothetical protein